MCECFWLEEWSRAQDSPVHIWLCVLLTDPPKEQHPGKGKGLTEFCYWLQEKELVLVQQGARKGNKREKYKEN